MADSGDSDPVDGRQPDLQYDVRRELPPGSYQKELLSPGVSLQQQPHRRGADQHDVGLCHLKARGLQDRNPKGSDVPRLKSEKQGAPADDLENQADTIQLDRQVFDALA